MYVALALYPKFTLLDIVGPFQVLADVPGVDVTFVAQDAGPVIDHTGVTPLLAAKTFDQVTTPDVVVVPGTLGGNEHDDALVAWLRRVHPTTTWTTSVCTGSIALAAAGILDGIDATTHWARKDALERFGARYTVDRVVERGKVITAAGVSSGIDMALTLVGRLYGPEMAMAAQLGIEYDPEPPFDAGSPAKAPDEIVELVKMTLDAAAAEGIAARAGGGL
jgi:transcriptional regulator GlxA family with amidase domain